MRRRNAKGQFCRNPHPKRSRRLRLRSVRGRTLWPPHFKMSGGRAIVRGLSRLRERTRKRRKNPHPRGVLRRGRAHKRATRIYARHPKGRLDSVGVYRTKKGKRAVSRRRGTILRGPRLPRCYGIGIRRKNGRKRRTRRSRR